MAWTATLPLGMRNKQFSSGIEEIEVEEISRVNRQFLGYPAVVVKPRSILNVTKAVA